MAVQRERWLQLIVAIIFAASQASTATHMQTCYESEQVTVTFDVILKASSPFEMLLNGDSFYRNGTLSATTLSESQFRRFHPHVLTNPDGTDNVHLDVTTIESDDSGIYVLEGVTPNGTVVQAETNLMVFYKPSLLWCILLINGTLSCKATQGYPYGMVACYQEGFSLGALDEVSDRDTLTVTYLVNSSLSINCCAKSRSFPIPKKECTEYMYSPPTHLPVTPTQLYIGHDKSKTLGFLCMLIFFTIVIYPLALLYHFKWQDQKYRYDRVPSIDRSIDQKPNGDLHPL